MPQQTWIAIDLGAESGRVINGSFDGQKVSLAEQHRFANQPVSLGGQLHWNMLELWREIQTGLGRAVQASATRPLSAGVDTWGVDFALLSPAGQLLSSPVHYRDPRTAGMLAAATSRVPRREIFGATGVQFMEINTLYQLLALQKTDREFEGVARRQFHAERAEGRRAFRGAGPVVGRNDVEDAQRGVDLYGCRRCRHDQCGA